MRIAWMVLLMMVPAMAQTRPSLPPAEPAAKAALDASPRHGEWVEAKLADGKTVRCWIVYPESNAKAPVVIVIQEIFGLSDWLRATTDRLAADGFIAIAPDLLSGSGPNGGGTESFAGRDDVVKAVRDLKPDAVTRMLDAVADYAATLPAANGNLATIGFCWGGAASFAYAAHQDKLAAAIVCYGTPPKADLFAQVHCPVLGLYGGDDNRVTSTVPAATKAMEQAGKTYEPHVFDGAGHGFFRQQDGRGGANARAAEEGWALVLAFLKKHTS